MTDAENAPVQNDAPKNESEISSGEKFLGAIAYISFFCILPLVLKRDSEFCQLHGKQGLLLTLVFFFFSWLGWFSWGMGVMLVLIHVVIAVLGILNASKGKMWKMPILGDATKKLDF
jgi:uncharacterized membrane protein